MVFESMYGNEDQKPCKLPWDFKSGDYGHVLATSDFDTKIASFEDDFGHYGVRDEKHREIAEFAINNLILMFKITKEAKRIFSGEQINILKLGDLVQELPEDFEERFRKLNVETSE